jgi:hypothetical protein
MTQILFSIGFLVLGFGLLFLAGFVPDIPLIIKGLIAVFSATSLVLALYYVVKEYDKEYDKIKQL